MNKGHFKLVLKSLLFLTLLLPIVLFIAKAGQPAEAAPNSTLSFNPATLTVSPNQAFSLDAVISPGTNQITAVELHVTFDATKLKLNSVTNGSAFSQVLQAAAIDNTAGTASITVGTPLTNPPSPVKTASTVATLAFQAIGQGAISVGFASSTQAAAVNETANVITTRSSSQISVVKKYGNSDFAALVTDWLQTKSSPADANGDGTVNTKDLGIMMCNWGS